MWRTGWNKFVSGFETGVWNITLVLTGLMEQLGPLQDILPPNIGRWLIVIGVIGAVLRYAVEIGWVKKVDEDVA